MSSHVKVPTVALGLAALAGVWYLATRAHKTAQTGDQAPVNFQGSSPSFLQAPRVPSDDARAIAMIERVARSSPASVNAAYVSRYADELASEGHTNEAARLRAVLPRSA